MAAWSAAHKTSLRTCQTRHALAADREVALLPGRREGPLDELVHAGVGRAVAGPVDQRAHGIGFALGLEFDAAVRQVAHPAPDAERPGLLERALAVRDALHDAADDHVDPDAHPPNLDERGPPGDLGFTPRDRRPCPRMPAAASPQSKPDAPSPASRPPRIAREIAVAVPRCRFAARMPACVDSSRACWLPCSSCRRPSRSRTTRSTTSPARTTSTTPSP